jgi:integrase
VSQHSSSLDDLFGPVACTRAQRTGLWRDGTGRKRIAKKAGFKDVTPHTLRHSFASVAADLGYTEPTIAAMLGHAAGSITSRYIYYLDSVLISAADNVAATIHAMMVAQIGESELTQDNRVPAADDGRTA